MQARKNIRLFSLFAFWHNHFDSIQNNILLLKHTDFFPFLFNTYFNILNRFVNVVSRIPYNIMKVQAVRQIPFFLEKRLGVRLIFDSTPQIIVQWFQIAAPRWPNHITSAADNVIFKNRAQNIECSFSCMACSAVLFKTKCCQYPSLQFLWQKFV